MEKRQMKTSCMSSNIKTIGYEESLTRTGTTSPFLFLLLGDNFALEHVEHKFKYQFSFMRCNINCYITKSISCDMISSKRKKM